MNKIEELYKQQHQLLTDAKALLEKDGELTDQQSEQINRWLSQAEEIEKKAKQLEAILQKEEALVADQQAEEIKRRETKMSKADKEAGFQHNWEFMKAVGDHFLYNKTDPRLYALQQKDLAGEQGIYGGFLIPTIGSNQILQTLGETSFVAQRARKVPMGSRLVNWPAVDYTQGAAGVSAFFGGVQVYYTEENAEITESNVKFRAVELHAREVAGYVEVPNGLLRDSAISLEAFFSGPGSFGGALAWNTDYRALRGDGVGKPLGILAADASLSTTRNTASSFKFVDAVTMASKMVMTNGTQPVWVINQAVLPQLYQMIDGASNNIWQPNAAVGRPDTLLGYPIIWTEKLPVLGTAGDVMLIDFGWYLLGERQGVTMDVDRSVKFKNNQTAFRVLMAHDGQPWINASITLADGSTSVSPFQYLT